MWFNLIKYSARSFKKERGLCIWCHGKGANGVTGPSSPFLLPVEVSFSSQQTPLRMNVANNDCEVNDYHHQTIIWSLILVVWFILMYYKVGFQNITRTRKTFTSLVEPPLDLHSGFCDSFHYLRTLFSASGMDVVLFLSISVPVSHIRS